MKECIILAGGLGTRLRSVVADTPKCMATVVNRPFLEYLFQYLEREKFDHIVLALGYKSELITDWINTRTSTFKISYVIEKEPLGTGGAIYFAFEKVKSERALVINGDTYFDVNTDQLFDLHNNKNADISLALKPMKNFDRYGNVLLNDQSRVIRFEEKTPKAEGTINGGVYIIDKTALKPYKLGEKFSFEKSVLEDRIKELNIYGCPFDNYFIDIGIPSDFEKANLDFVNKFK